MVTGGLHVELEKSVELLSSNGTWLCYLPDLPARRYAHSQTGLIACGGGGSSEHKQSCVTFSAGRWNKTHDLGQCGSTFCSRYGHTGSALPQGVLLIGGIFGDPSETSLLTDNGGATPSFNLDHVRQ